MLMSGANLQMKDMLPNPCPPPKEISIPNKKKFSSYLPYFILDIPCVVHIFGYIYFYFITAVGLKIKCAEVFGITIVLIFPPRAIFIDEPLFPGRRSLLGIF
jgi:hypothetical protein